MSNISKIFRVAFSARPAQHLYNVGPTPTCITSISSVCLNGVNLNGGTVRHSSFRATPTPTPLNSLVGRLSLLSFASAGSSAIALTSTERHFSTLPVSTLELPSLRCQKLREAALTHGSVCPELGKIFQRLEFLGDSALGFIVAEYLYSLDPPLDQGLMTKMRSQLVRAEQLEGYGNQFDLLRHIRHNLCGEISGAEKTNLIADAFEAYIGAYFLEVGITPVRELLLPLIETALKSQPAVGLDLDNAKNALHEAVINTLPKNFRNTWSPEYRVSRSGQDHCPVFTVEVWFLGRRWAESSSDNKKKAEKLAATEALVCFRQVSTECA